MILYGLGSWVSCFRALAGLQTVDKHAKLYCRRPEQFEALEKSNRPPSYVFIDQPKQPSIISISEILNSKDVALQVVNDVRISLLKDMCVALQHYVDMLPKLLCMMCNYAYLEYSHEGKLVAQ